jgi:hypothetical protein
VVAIELIVADWLSVTQPKSGCVMLATWLSRGPTRRYKLGAA